MQQTKTEDVEVFERIKIRFLRFRKILRQSINEAKRSYFQTTFERFKHDINKPGLSLMKHYVVKKRNSFTDVSTRW